MGVVAGVRVDLSGLRAEKLLEETSALDAGLDYLLVRTKERAPKLTGRLDESGKTFKISPTFGGIAFSGLPYARKQEERGWQKHPHGGQAHFTRDTWEHDMPEALNRIIDRMTSTA